VAEPAVKTEQEEKPLEDTVVKIYRCAKVVKGGRRFSFSALVVLGDRNGTVGFGYGKAKEVPMSVEKGLKDARKSLTKWRWSGLLFLIRSWGGIVPPKLCWCRPVPVLALLLVPVLVLYSNMRASMTC